MYGLFVRIPFLPVVNAGVHSCSPVAPQSKVKVFDGSTVTIGPAGECRTVDFRLSIFIKLIKSFRLRYLQNDTQIKVISNSHSEMLDRLQILPVNDWFKDLFAAEVVVVVAGVVDCFDAFIRSLSQFV